MRRKWFPNSDPGHCDKCGSKRHLQSYKHDNAEYYIPVCNPCLVEKIRIRKGESKKVRIKVLEPKGHSFKWDRNNPDKRRAHKIVEVAMRNGTLVRQSCERCGTDKNVHAHHEDYSRPLEVMWLCQPHHKERHKELKEFAGAPPARTHEPRVRGL
jgi:hypothetical protein